MWELQTHNLNTDKTDIRHVLRLTPDFPIYTILDKHNGAIDELPKNLIFQWKIQTKTRKLSKMRQKTHLLPILGKSRARKERKNEREERRQRHIFLRRANISEPKTHGSAARCQQQKHMFQSKKWTIARWKMTKKAVKRKRREEKEAADEVKKVELPPATRSSDEPIPKKVSQLLTYVSPIVYRVIGLF